jgi:hypothetical protein
MSANNLRRFANPEILKAIQPKHLLALLLPHAGYLASRGIFVPALDTGRRIDLDALLDVLIRPDAETPQGLAEAFYFVHQLGVEDAFDALLDAADQNRIDLDYADQTPEDVVAQLWLRDRTILDRILGKRVARRRRQFMTFQGTGKRTTLWTAPTAETIQALEHTLNGWYQSHNRGPGAKVLPIVALTRL